MYVIQLNIRAYDLGTPSLADTAIITVIVKKIDSPLSIINYNFSIAENLPVGRELGVVVASPSVSLSVCLFDCKSVYRSLCLAVNVFDCPPAILFLLLIKIVMKKII